MGCGCREALCICDSGQYQGLEDTPPGGRRPLGSSGSKSSSGSKKKAPPKPIRRLTNNLERLMASSTTSITSEDVSCQWPYSAFLSSE